MIETIVAALISAFAAIVVGAAQNNAQNNKTRALIEYRLKELEKKQDKHNDVIERTYKLEQNVAVMEEQIKVSQHRIDDLEKHEERRMNDGK